MNNQPTTVFIDIKFLKSLHENLGIIQIVFQNGGLPSTIKPEDLKALDQTCTILEKLVTYIKQKQI